MLHQLTIRVVFVVALTLSTAALAQQGPFGTAAEAKAMLAKAVAAVKADKAKALELFNKGEEATGFKDRDLYPFCFNVEDGKITVKRPGATGSADLRGRDVRTLKDETGQAFGDAIYKAAQKEEGTITEVSYMFPRPGTDTTPVQKVSFVTRVGDQGCGVGYYK
jgi:hypothetical protein